MQPNEQQQEAADKLVQMLDLAPAGKEELLPPNLTPNPLLEVLSVLSPSPENSVDVLTLNVYNNHFVFTINMNYYERYYTHAST